MRWIFFCFLMIVPCVCQGVDKRLQALRNSLDPSSIPQLLAFYELYPESSEGKSSLEQAWRLLGGRDGKIEGAASLPRVGVDAIISLVNKGRDVPPPSLEDPELEMIDRLAARLHNRGLKGRRASNNHDILALDDKEIDLSRALLIAQYGDNASELPKIRSYEAIIDLMALQVLARLPDNASDQDKIRGINELIFYEMQFRFPPHSTYAENIDLYSFLPSVLDSQRGVCLGVSLLYLSIAQRLDLPLEIVTPPGHIYVRYKKEGTEINIETTARGINVPSEVYLGIDTRSLQLRTIKETIGLIYLNQASVFWRQKEYSQALDTYLKARPFLPDDKLLTEFLAYQYLFTDQKEEGERLLKQVQGHVPDYSLSGETVADDYLQGKANAAAIQMAFMQVDETQESIIEKRDALLIVTAQWPQFRAGLFHLAITWLQLHRNKEALSLLERYHTLDPNDPTVEYYLAALYTQRRDYINAWKHLKQVEAIAASRNHHPRALKMLRNELNTLFPQKI